MALEVLGIDCRIRMDRKEPRVIRESRDGGGVRHNLSAPVLLCCAEIDPCFVMRRIVMYQ